MSGAVTKKIDEYSDQPCSRSQISRRSQVCLPKAKRSGWISSTDRPSDDEYRPLTNPIQKYGWVNPLSRL